jgi:microcystin-dependent protein
MSDPFLGEVRIMSFNFAPKGWAMCNGALMPINQNQALFSLLGTTYGGNGSTTFALPDLRARVPMMKAVSASGGHTQGERAGERSHTLTIQELPQHVHTAFGTQTAADSVLPDGRLLANVNLNAYAPQSPPQPIAPDTLATVGGSQPHENMSPYLALTFCIALQGLFPSQN